jgi:hypothetical protein
MPVPAPRQKGIQSSEVSHLVSNKSPDDIVTGKFMMHAGEFRNASVPSVRAKMKIGYNKFQCF